MAKSQIDKLTELVEKLISNPIAPIAPVAPVAPVLPIVRENTGDHDILTEFRAESKIEFKNINAALVKLQESNASYVTRPEHDEVIKTVDAQGVDIKDLKSKNMWFSGALATLSFVIVFCGVLISYIYFTAQAAQDVKIDQILTALNK